MPGQQQTQIYQLQTDGVTENVLGITAAGGLTANTGTPAGTVVTATNTAAAAASCAATLPGVAGKTTWITGFTITTANPAAAVTGVATVTGTVSGSLNYQVVETVAAGAVLTVSFPTPVPASATNTPIVVTLPAITGGAVSAVSATGFQL